jgi:hypothetical protein
MPAVSERRARPAYNGSFKGAVDGTGIEIGPAVIVPACPHTVMVTRPHVVSTEDNMADYRAYLIDQNNRVLSAKEIQAASDEEALSAARQFVDGYDVEVWCLDRKVGRFKGH